MAWRSTQVRYWTVCWAWIFPYPCRKTKTKQCCTGILKVQCYGFFGRKWFCCDGRESFWWGGCWGVGNILASGVTVCRNSVPSERDNCPHTVGDVPVIVQSTIVGIVVATLSGLTAASAFDDTNQIIAWAVTGLVFGVGLGIGHMRGFLISLLGVVIAASQLEIMF